jgi:hypothetical protein
MENENALSNLINFLIKKGIKQQALADVLKVDKSIVTRLKGGQGTEKLKQNYIAILQDSYNDVIANEIETERVPRTETQVLEEISKDMKEILTLLKHSKENKT